MKLTAENSKGEKMKYRLARSMKECMKTMSVDNITVKQITENCGVTRQTFYRNFMDKFDLINWYFDKLLAKSFEHMGMGKTVYDALVKKFTYIQEEHVFFAAAFKYDSQNSLRQHDFELILDFYENLIREKTGRIPDETIHCILEMYCHSSIYMTVKWVLGELECAPEGLAKILVDGMPGKLSELFEKLEQIQEGDILVLAGSIPNTLPEDIYERILERLSGKEIRFVVDATKDLLLKVMKYHPFLIKPNNHELGEMFNVELKRKEDIIIYAKKLQALGAQHVLVSMAGDGAILVTKDGKVYETMPPKGKVVNSVGAGDSMVAGFITGYLNTKDMEKAFRLGILFVARYKR